MDPRDGFVSHSQVRLSDGSTIPMVKHGRDPWLVSTRDVDRLLQDQLAEQRAEYDRLLLRERNRAEAMRAAMELNEKDNVARLAAERRVANAIRERLGRNRKRAFYVRYHLEKALAKVVLGDQPRDRDAAASIRFALRTLEAHIESLRKAEEE